MWPPVCQAIGDELLIGSAFGDLATLDAASLTKKVSQKVLGGVTSIAPDSTGEFFFVGTAESNIYLLQVIAIT